MKKQLKKPFLMMAVTALVLVGTLKVGGAMAYFTTYSTASCSDEYGIYTDNPA